MHKAQERVQELLDRLVEQDKEAGLQVAVYKDGELVVDAWAGLADVAVRRPVDGGTLFPVYSTTKGIASTIIHRLVERGRVDYDDRIAEYWPEFGARGKSQITLRQVLNHTAGIPQMPTEIGFAELCDWDSMCAAIAGLEPEWEPGSRRVYHAMTFGWIVGEVARRVDGRPFGEILRTDICEPLGIEDLYVGIPDEVEPRVAVLDAPGDPPAPYGGVTARSIPSWLGPLDLLMNRGDVRRACIPATNGIMSSRAIARHYAALLPGGIDGVELLPPERVEIACQLQESHGGSGEISGQPIALGYFLMGEGNRAFGHAGFGGSVGVGDVEARIALGLTKNRCRESEGNRGTTQAVIDTVRAAL